MHIERKAEGLTGPARIGRVSCSKRVDGNPGHAVATGRRDSEPLTVLAASSSE
jgi:hypothetical protein